MQRPKLNSQWWVVGTNYQFEIVNTWGTGTGPNYRTTFYELKYTHRKEVQVKAAADFEKLIEEQKIKILNK